MACLMWIRSGDRSPSLRRCLSLISITIFGGVSPVVINERPKETKTQWRLREAKKTRNRNRCAALLLFNDWGSASLKPITQKKSKTSLHSSSLFANLQCGKIAHSQYSYLNGHSLSVSLFMVLYLQNKWLIHVFFFFFF